MLKMELWNEVNSGTAADTILNLSQRWLDEQDYEDINEYLQVIQKQIPQAYKMSKRPFGVTCKCEDGNLLIYVKLTNTSIQLNGKNVE